MSGNLQDGEEASVILDQRFVYDTYAVKFFGTSKFEQGETYTIKFEYMTEILDANTGVYCALDPDFQIKN